MDPIQVIQLVFLVALTGLAIYLVRRNSTAPITSDLASQALLNAAKSDLLEVRNQLNAAVQQAGRLEADVDRLVKELAQADEKKQFALNELAKQHKLEKENALSQLLAQHNKDMSERESLIAALQTERTSLEARAEQYEKLLAEEKLRYKHEIEEQKKLREKLADEIEQVGHKLKLTLTNVTADMVDKGHDTLVKKAKESFQDVLVPVAKFNEAIESQIKEAKENKGAFEAQIKNLHEATEKLKVDAQNLTEALKGKKQLQGNWGEVQLQNLLDTAGLTQDIDYKTQATHRNEDADWRRPDVILKLPNNKHIIVDAKVSLNNYLQAINATTETDAQAALGALAGDLKKHITTLGDKEYNKLAGLNSPEYTLLFVPIETAFIAALQKDPSLFDYAMKKRIVLVTPSTLMATLSVVKTILDQEKRTKNAEEIAKLGASIYEKIVNFSKSFQAIKEKLKDAADQYDKAEGQLLFGKGNAISQLDKMKAMGLASAKQLPQEWLDKVETAEEFITPEDQSLLPPSVSN